MTKSAALEYAARGIRINAICPGVIDTPMVANAVANEPEAMKAVLRDIPLGRMGKSEEIASAVLWLCSPGAGFMVGQIIVPDGGYNAMSRSRLKMKTDLGALPAMSRPAF